MALPLAAIGLGANILGGLFGSSEASGDREQAMRLQREALENLRNVNVPGAEELRIQLEKYQSAGQLAPEMQSVIQQGPSAMGGIAVDPRLKQAQMAALSKLQEVGAGGLRPEDVAAVERVQQQAAQQARAQDEAILQQMQQRGMGGAGAELAARLGSSQAAAGRALGGGLDVAGQASQRALQAIMQSGQLGGQVRGQEFGEEAQKAQAADIIARYNAMNAQQIQGASVGARNVAQAGNLAQAQDIMNRNVAGSNVQQQYNKQIPMQLFQAQMAKAQAMTSPTRQLAGDYAARGEATAQGIKNIAGGVAQGLSAFGFGKEEPRQPSVADVGSKGAFYPIA